MCCESGLDRIGTVCCESGLDRGSLKIKKTVHLNQKHLNLKSRGYDGGLGPVYPANEELDIRCESVLKGTVSVIFK